MEGSRNQDIAYRIIDSPVGRLLLASTTDGLVRVAFEKENHARVLKRLAQEFGAVHEQLETLATAKQELDEYFAGQRKTFDLALDLRVTDEFQRTVLDQLSAIDYGTTASYDDVAKRSGAPRAAKEVGISCATNPLPIVIPCHRVVRGNGELGGYLGGVETKKTLIDLEAA